MVLLLEDDAAQRDLLLELFADGSAEVVVCATLDQIYGCLTRYPHAVVVADSWAADNHRQLSDQQRREITELAHMAPVILTTGREWARRLEPGELGTVVLVTKPYDLDELLDQVHLAQRRSPELRAEENREQAP
jgi:DNA-binding NtrC family response regulator